MGESESGSWACVLEFCVVDEIKGGLHLSENFSWWLWYVFGKFWCRNFLTSSFVNFYGLSGVRTWWGSWVRIRGCCGESEVHKPTGGLLEVLYPICSLYLCSRNNQLDLNNSCDKYDIVIDRCHCAYMYWYYLLEFWVYRGLYYLYRMEFGY